MISSSKPNLSFTRTRSRLFWNQEDQEELPSGLEIAGMSRIEQFLWTKKVDELATKNDWAQTIMTADFWSYLWLFEKISWLYSAPTGPVIFPSCPTCIKVSSEKIPIFRLKEQRRIFVSFWEHWSSLKSISQVNQIKDKVFKTSSFEPLRREREVQLKHRMANERNIVTNEWEKVENWSIFNF